MSAKWSVVKHKDVFYCYKTAGGYHYIMITKELDNGLPSFMYKYVKNTISITAHVTRPQDINISGPSTFREAPPKSFCDKELDELRQSGVIKYLTLYFKFIKSIDFTDYMQQFFEESK